MPEAKRPRRSMTQVRRDDIAAGVRYISYRAKPPAATALQALCDARAAAGMDSSTTATLDAAVAGELARMTADDSMPVVDFRQEASRQIAEHIAMKVDAVLRDAVSRFLGRSDWTMAELQGRASRQVVGSTEIFYLDGMPLVELPAVRTETASKTGILRATQDFRLRV